MQWNSSENTPTSSRRTCSSSANVELFNVDHVIINAETFLLQSFTLHFWGTCSGNQVNHLLCLFDIMNNSTLCGDQFLTSYRPSRYVDETNEFWRLVNLIRKKKVDFRIDLPMLVVFFERGNQTIFWHRTFIYIHIYIYIYIYFFFFFWRGEGWIRNLRWL